MSKRTDIHRPGAIVPAQYRYVLSYQLATTENGWPVPPVNVDLVVGLQESRAFAATGGLGKCSVCGSHFIYGDVWVHVETQEHIHVGHNCADKYSLLADRSAYELEAGRTREAAAREVQKKLNREQVQAFLDANPGLEEALKADHHISRDLGDKLRQYKSLSVKQVALALKIHTEAQRPPAEQERLVPAPLTSKRETLRGVIVSTKIQEGDYGVSYKMTVKVTTQVGNWLAWGTIPAALLEQSPCNDGGRVKNLRGATVEVKAGLKPGREAHFAILVRPVATLISLATPELAAARAEELKRESDYFAALGQALPETAPIS